MRAGSESEELAGPSTGARYFENVRQRVQAAAPPDCVRHVVRTR